MLQATNMAEIFDLILLHGPSFAGRNYYIEDNLKGSHVEIIPRKIFQSNSTIGLRDIILKVIVLLKENKKVVVNDENCNRTTWDSYINMVNKKTKSKTIALVSVLPKHGLQQLYWSRQLHMLDSDQWELTLDSQLTKWFDSTMNISYHNVDEPLGIEGIEIFCKNYPLILQKNVQANIPALFLQWETVFSSSDVSLKAGVIKTCQLWSQKFQGGRIFLLLDLTKKTVDIDTTFKEHIRNCMKTLVQKLEDIPVYLYSIDKDTVKFAIPPSPGVLATIQKSHGVDLLNKNTVLLFCDQAFSKMAEIAGVQYVAASKVFQKPTLILNKLMFTSPRPPEFLQDMRVEFKNKQPVYIPLYELKDSFCDGCISHKVNPGIEVFLYSSNFQSIDHFQAKFLDFIQCERDDALTQLQHMETSHVTSDDDEVIIQNKSFSRELPKWMLGTSKSSSSSHRSDSVNSNASVDVKVKSTVYVMSEQELVEVATDILKQAGREDILKRLQESRSLSNHIQVTGNEDTTEKCSKSRPKTPVKCSEKKGTHSGTGQMKTRDSTYSSTNIDMKNNRSKDILNTEECNTKNVGDNIENYRDSQKTVHDTLNMCGNKESVVYNILETVDAEYSKCLNTMLGHNDPAVIKTEDMLNTDSSSPSKRRKYTDVLDTLCLDLGNSCHGQSKPGPSQNNQLDEISKNEKTNQNLTKLTRNHVPRFSKRLCDHVEKEDLHGNFAYCAESSNYESPQVIDPTKIFKNLDEKLTGSKKSIDEKIHRENHSSSVTKNKKPDLSFLDDIFG